MAAGSSHRDDNMKLQIRKAVPCNFANLSNFASQPKIPISFATKSKPAETRPIGTGPSRAGHCYSYDQSCYRYFRQRSTYQADTEIALFGAKARSRRRRYQRSTGGTCLGSNVVAIYPTGGAIGKLLHRLVEREDIDSVVTPSHVQTRKISRLMKKQAESNIASPGFENCIPLNGRRCSIN